MPPKFIWRWKGIQKHLADEYDIKLSERMLFYWHERIPFPLEKGFPGTVIRVTKLRAYVKKRLK